MDLKRTLEEVYTLYGLEPGLRDIFVEGTGDKFFFDWYLRRKEITNVSVYPIELIDISDEILAKYALPTASNRSRIIALSFELTNRLAVGHRVMCIADRDYEDYCPTCENNPYLFWTDGNSLEVYALTPTVMEKFLFVALAGFPLSVESFIRQVVGILEQVFAIRLANERLRWGMTWIPFEGYIEVSSANIRFKEKEFVRAYLSKNSKSSQRQHFEKTVGEIKSSLFPNAWRKIRGHDLASLILVIVRKLRRERQFGNVETLEGCLMTAIESNDLEGHSLFRSIDSLLR